MSAADPILSAIAAANDLRGAYRLGVREVVEWPHLADELERLAAIIEGADPHLAGDLEDLAASIRRHSPGQA